jgi:hypothetical protein
MWFLYSVGFIVVHYSLQINYNLIQDSELFIQWFFLYILLTCIIWYNSNERELPFSLISICVTLYGIFIVPLTQELTWLHQVGGYTTLCVFLWGTMGIANQNAKLIMTWDTHDESKLEYNKHERKKQELWKNIIQ